MARRTPPSQCARQENAEWEILRDAPPDDLPVPKTGRFVIALGPPMLDGEAELQRIERYIPGRKYLALLWENSQGEEVLHPVDPSGCLLMGQ
jgi:hypothetical protein